MSFEILESQALPFAPTLHLSEMLGIISSDEQIIKPFALTSAFFDILRQHTEYGESENSESQNIENIVSYAIAHKRADSVEQKI